MANQLTSKLWLTKIKSHLKKLSKIKTGFFCFDPMDIYSGIDQKDLALTSLWTEPLKNTEHNVSKKEGFIAKMISARAAEKVAFLFYEGMGVPVKDISIHQVTKESEKWKTFDLLLGREDLGITALVDVKNARGSKENSNSFSEFCVPKFKKYRDNSEVNILGILSPYLQYKFIKSPSLINFDIEPIRVLGEANLSTLESLRQRFHTSKLNLCLLREDGMESYLPRWVFDGPDHLYFRLERKLKSDFEDLSENLLALDKENVSREKINPIAECNLSRETL